MVTSVRAGEGKTCTAANLAVALASSERRVLLIDADLRKPDQHRLFDTPLEGGLSELILKTPTISDGAIERPAVGHNLRTSRLLTSGIVPANPAELLASKRAWPLLKSIGPEEDLIVIDTAPAGLVTDPFSIAAGASATILVVEAGKTKASQAGGTRSTRCARLARMSSVSCSTSPHAASAPVIYQYGYARYGQTPGHEPSADAGRSRAAPGQLSSSNGHAPAPETSARAATPNAPSVATIGGVRPAHYRVDMHKSAALRRWMKRVVSGG